MECREVRQLAEPFASDQLLVETAQRIVAHTERCAPCRDELDGLRRLRAATRAAFDGAAELRARPEFAAALAGRLQAVARPSGTSASRRLLAVAATLVLVLGGGFSLERWSALGFATLLHAAAGDHQFCALTYRLAAPPIALAEAARQYDASDAALETVDLVPAALSGGPVEVLERHSCVYDGRRFAHIVVRYEGGDVSILVAEPDRFTGILRPGLSQEAEAMPPTGGFHVAAFRAAHRTVFVVSALDAAAVDEVARAVAKPMARALAGV